MRRWICALTVCLLLLTLTPAWAETKRIDTWYEIFPRSYRDSDGDGLGDLQGIMEKLDYISGMGYTGIWLMPVMASPSYHKYDVMDYCSIDPEYGTMEDLRQLTRACHARDIRLILDLPLNHTSTRHPWFIQACDALKAGDVDCPYVDYYVFTDQNGGSMVPLDDSGWYYEERFAGGNMPDLNLASEAVRGEIASILAFYLQYVGVDGFRLDAVTSYFAGKDDNIAFLRWLKETCEQLKPGSFLVGECWKGLNDIADYYASGVDAFFLFPVSQAEGSVCRALRARRPGEMFVSEMDRLYEALPDVLWAPFLSNHDTGRTVGSLQARQNLPRAKFAEAVLQLMGGASFTYYGEEIGMVGAGADPNKRLPMLWGDGRETELPPGTDRVEYAYPSVEEQEADPNSLLNYCRAVNALRKAHPEIAGGANRWVYAGDYAVIAERSEDGVSCLVAMNFSGSKTQTLTLDGLYTLSDEVETGKEHADVLWQRGKTVLKLPPYAVCVLKAAE